MLVIEFIETANWIISQYAETTKKLLFSGSLSHLRMLASRENDKANMLFTNGLIISQDLAIVRERLLLHPNAPQVLKAFGLSALLEGETSLIIGKYAYQATKAAGSNEPPSRDDIGESLIHNISLRWNVFTGCIKPVQALTIPKEVQEEKPFDDTLTIELDYGDAYPQASIISKALDNTTKLYEAFADASGNGEFPPLVIIYASSGSAFRFDLKGLGDPIKQLKGIFVDAWRLIRHRKADDFQKNGKAIVDGLDILERIEATRRKNALTSEEASRLKLNINRAMLSLLEAGAMPREIPDIEDVENRKLMKGIQQKLLPPAPQEAEKKGAARKTKSHKAKSRAGKRSKKKSDDSDDKSIPE